MAQVLDCSCLTKGGVEFIALLLGQACHSRPHLLARCSPDDFVGGGIDHHDADVTDRPVPRTGKDNRDDPNLLGLTERPHAVLSARSDGTAALAFYAAKGWRIVHDGLRFPGSDAPYAVLVRDR